MPISSRAFRNSGKINSSAEDFFSPFRPDSLGNLDHVALDFSLRAFGAAAPGPAETSDGPGTVARAIPGGGIQVATNLTSAAGVAIVAYATDPIGADGDDIIRFVLLSAIGSGTQIFFTDRNWNGTAFAAASAGEGTFTYMAGADLAAGTVVTISSAQLLAAGMDLSNNGETIYAYQGAINAPTTFLYAIDVGDDNDVFEAGELTGTGLTAGVNAVAVRFDQASYAGPSTQIAATQLAEIGDTTQWHGHSGDDIGGTIYDDRADVTLSGPLTNPDMQLFGMMSGGGQSDAFIRMDNEEGANVATNLTRLFRDNPMFNHLTDLAFDIEDGVWFAVDNDGTATTRILKGNIADLVSGTRTPTITVVYDFPNDDDNVPVDDDTFIDGIEIDTVNNQVYFIQGEIANGHNLMRVGYNGGAVSNWGPLDLAADQTIGIFRGGIYDFTLDVAHNTAYFTYVLVDTNFNPARAHVNYIVKVNSLVNPNPAVENYTIVPINGPYSDDPDGAGTNPANHFPDVANGSLAGIDIDIANQRIYFVTQRLGANGQAGVFMYDIASHNVTLVWQQQSNNATNTLQPFPTTQMLYIEVDTIGGRYYLSTLNNTDTAIGHDGTATDEGGARIFSGSLTAFGVAPTFFASVFENTANGAVLGMEIDYAPTLTVGSAGSTYTESTNLPNSPAGPTVDVATSPAVADADQAIIQGATAAITTGFMAGDTLTFTNSGGITGSYNAANGVVTFTGNASFAAYQTVLDSVRFTNAGDNPTNYGNSPSRTISFTVFDGLINSDPATATVAIVGINDAPVNTSGAAMAFTEDTTGHAGAEGIPPTAPRNAVTGISVFDVDADPANEDITVTLAVGIGTLTIRTDVSGGIVAGDITGGANGTGTITITATQNQINATLAAMSPAFTGPPVVAAAPNGLIYTPPANYNGATNLTITTNDLGNNGNDPGLTGGGTDEQDQDVKVINIAHVNDAPTVTDATQAAATILEDIPSAAGETVTSLFNASFSDALDQQQTGGNPTGSAANTLAGIAVVANGSSGATGQWQYFNGTIWVDIGAASLASAQLINAGTAIRFNPALNFNGAAPTLTVHLVDSSGGPFLNGDDVNLTGATGGTTRYSTGTVVLSQDITPVNDAPTSGSLAGDTATYTEQQALAALLDVGTNATVADVDSPNFDTGTLTVEITSGLVAAEDRLVIRISGTVSFNATNVFVGGIDIGTYSGHNSSGPLVFTFNANATPARVAELIRAIAYNNSAGDDPTDGNRTITWTLVDGDGTANTGVDTLQVTTTLDVDPVNDAPQGADETIVMDEDGTRILNAGNFNFTDPLDGDSFAGVVLTTLPASGDLYLNNVAITVAGTFVTIADINGGLLTYKPDPNGNGVGYATFTFQVRDNGGILDGGVDTDPNPDTITFDVNAFNDAPVNTLGATVVINEDAVDAPLTGMSILDVDAGNDPITVFLDVANGVLEISETVAGGLTAGQITDNGTGSVTIIASQSEINATFADANGVLYTPDANFNGDDTLTVTANDGGASGADGALEDVDTRTITVNSVNDAPAGASNTVTASEDDPYVFLTADFGFTDPIDGDDFAGIVLTTLPVEGDLRLNGVNITVAGTFITAADIAAGLLTFLADPDESGAAYASFTFQVRDDGGILFGGVDTDQSANTITIDVEPDNIAPTLDLDGDDSNTVGTGYTASFTEGGAAVLITDTDVAIVDPDVGSTIEGATITINSAVAGDQLVLGAQAAPFVVTGSGTGTITITGTGTAAQYEAMLEQITFSNTSDDPGATRTIDVTVTDGTANSNIAVSTINITQVNDEPTLTATAVNPTFTEGGAAVDLFSGVTADTIEAGQTFVSLTLTVTNVTDGANEILVVDGMNVALTNGNVVATPAGNVTVTLAAGTATVVVGPSTLSEAALQTLIDGLAYLNTSENPTDANRVVTITQLVDSGSDTSPNDATLAPNIASTVNVDPVNDAPLNTVPGTQTINEDASVTLSTGNGNAIQVADADATTLTVTLTVLHGTLTLASTAGLSFGAGDGTGDLTMTFSGTAAAINAALGSGLTYNPNANFNGSDSIAVFTTDNGQSGGAAETDSDSVTINITAINDAPVVSGDGTESATTIDEDTPGAGQTIQALFAGQYSDAADNQVPNGGASSPGQFSGIAVTANGSSAATGQWQYFSGGVWTDIGTVSDAAAKLLGDPFVTLIRFNPAPDFNGPAPTLTVHLIDNSLGFGIVNGMVVDLSGPGATGGTTAYSTLTVVLSQTVTAVNDGPLNTVPGAQTINEDASFTLSTGNGNAIQVADADATTLTVTLTVLNGTLTLASTAGLSFSGGSDGTADVTMTFSGTAAAINAALGSGLTYNPTANYNGPDSIAVLTTDNGQTGTGGTLQDNDSIAITVNPVNDAPAGTNNTVTGSEDDPYVFTLADFGFSDAIEGDDFAGVVFTTVPTTGTLFYDADGPGGAAPVALADGAGPIAAADIAAGKVYFVPVADAFGSPYASFTFQVQDDGGMLNGGVDTDPTPRTMTINVTPDNLAPAVDLNGAGAGLDAAVSYTEDAPGVSIGSGITVSDPNEVTGDLIESATITLTDAVAGDALTVTLPLPGGITAVTTNPAGQIVVTLSGPASTSDYAAAIAQVLYSTSNQDPTLGGTDPARTITVTVNDGLLSSAVATSTVTITPLDDAAVAQPDALTTDEATILSDSVFPDNGSGADNDVDGPALEVAAVNGSTTDVGNLIVLASGAELTLRADGTFDYDPNGQFNTLPGPASGASNLTDTDSFTYTLVNGNEVTVTITITGVDSDGDILLGTPGLDSLDGGIGADHMTGFAGNDTYFIDNAGDTVVEAAGQGADTIRTSVSLTLAAGLSIETLTTTSQVGTTAIDLTGNEIDNRIEGNDGVNALIGNGGVDLLYGHGGDDTLTGGAQGDLLDGGDGLDTTLFADSFVTYADTLAGWIVVSSEGSDVLRNVEAVVDGSGRRTLLVGSTGFATFQGAADEAADTNHVRLAANNYGGTVNYAANGLIVIGQTGSQQGVVYNNALSGVGITVIAANLADTITTDDGNDRVFGNGGVDVISTGAGNDLLNGGDGGDTLTGGAGNDSLTGGAGNDAMAGGADNDIYHVTEAGDVVTEAIGGGSDTVYSGVDYSLNDTQEVETLAALSFTDTTMLKLTGNGLANYMIGNDGANQLNGKGGADTMTGRAGHDKYFVDNAGDKAFETAGGGTDIVYTSVDFTLANDQEIESLSTITWELTDTIHLTGNGLNNQLFGNAGANRLDGKGGNDALHGKGGQDVFAFTTALGANNVDDVFGFASGDDRIELDNAIFTQLLLDGALDPNAFVIGPAATTDDHRIVYNGMTGELYYDVDGVGGQAAMLFATLKTAPALDAADIFVI